MSLKELKQYLRVDYTDDDSMIELMHDAVIDEMKELIPSFDPEKPTNRPVSYTHLGREKHRK